MGFFDRFRRKELRTVPREKMRMIPYVINTWKYHNFDGRLYQIDLIRGCIDSLARNLAKMELNSVMIDSTTGIAKVDSTSDIARVMRHPNPHMTTYDFVYKVASLYFLNNNVFIYPDYDRNGNLIAMYPINYQTVHLMTANDRLYVQFRMNYFHTYTVPYENLIHLRNHYVEDDFLGDGNLDAMTPVAELLNAQNTGIVNGIKNSALIRGILKTVNVVKEEDLIKARDRFIADNLQASNSGGVITVDGKFDYTPIESKPYIIDAESMEQAKSKIYDYFGVNEDFLQNKFTSERYEAVYEGKLEPFAIMLTQALTYGLFTDRERGFGNRIEVNMARLKYQPVTVITAMIQATNQLGLFTRNEYRSMLGYAPLSDEQGGNEIMIAVNNYQASENSKEAEDPAQEENDNDSDEI